MEAVAHDEAFRPALRTAIYWKGSDLRGPSLVQCSQSLAHDRAIVSSMLTVVALAQLDTGDLSDGIGLVGRFQDASQKRLFWHRLRSLLGVDAG